jgi:hypothetical protein
MGSEGIAQRMVVECKIANRLEAWPSDFFEMQITESGGWSRGKSIANGPWELGGARSQDPLEGFVEVAEHFDTGFTGGLAKHFEHTSKSISGVTTD